MRITASAISNKGRVRSENEDNLLFAGQFLPEKHDSLTAPLAYDSAKEEPVLLGVFDGMGGHASGEKASCLAAKTACEVSKDADCDDAKALLARICERANRIVSSADTGEGRKMGTTAAMLHIGGGRYTACNVGDSPIFLLRGGRLEKLYVEDTEKASYEAIFKKKAEPGRKFSLTQCFGGGMEEVQIEPHFVQGDILPGDVFLLCSDGISDMLDEGELTEVLSGAQSTGKMASELEKRALEKGGKDNLTAICVRAEEEKNDPYKTMRETASAFGLLAALIAAGCVCGWLLAMLV